MLGVMVGAQAAIAGVTVLAHPHGTTGGIWFPGALALTAGACLAVAVLAAFAPARGTPAPGAGRPGPVAVPASHRAAWGAVRALAAVGFLLLIVAGRVWNSGLAPVLLVMVGLPALLLLNGVFGRVWEWIDPFDTLATMTARLAGLEHRGRDAGPPGVTDEVDVRPAVVPAAAWMVYLTAYDSPLDPRVLALALTGYTVALLVGCVVAGRRSWIRDVEVLGAILRWVGHVRRGGLVSWEPPRGAAAVCGVLLGGLLFEGLHTLFLSEHPTTSPARWLLLAAVLASAAVGAALVGGMDAWAGRLGAAGSVTAAAVPMVAAMGVSMALADNRLLIGLQLLPRLLADPLGRGAGPLEVAVAADPLGPVGLLALQSLVLLVGAVVAVRVARSRSPDRRAPLPAVTTVEILLALAILGAASR